MELASVILKAQREALRKAHNARFIKNGMEYKVCYEGGLAETFGIYGRPVGARNFTYITGFAGYKMHNKEQVIAMAKNMVK